MKKIIIASFVATAFITGGCASSGTQALKTETQESIADKLTVGMPKSEVRTMFGEPNSSTRASTGESTWTYTFVKGQVKATNFIPYYGMLKGGSTSQSRNLLVNFGQDGKLVDYSMSTGQMDTNTGLIQ